MKKGASAGRHPGPAVGPGRGLPRYALVGLVIISLSEVLMLIAVEPFRTFHTAIAWTGYILVADGVTWMRRGRSWLTDSPGEFIFLALLSIPLWLVFEFFNLFIRNWRYVGLPRHPLVRNLGFAWAFATIWPAILITAEMIGSLRTPAPDAWSGGTQSAPSPETTAKTAGGRRSGFASVAAGAAILAWPIATPSPYLAAPVWLGFIFLLDPINARLGGEALFAGPPARRRNRLVNLALSGLLCGVLWEFWNYWAGAKWLYSVPILPDVKLFEMPLPGYLGFPAFALECFTMYVFVRHLVWRPPARVLAL